MTPDEATFILELNDEKPTEPPPPLISDYIQNRRILPPGSPRPGPIDINICPAMIEPMDNMSPYSGVKHTTMMKAVQILCTTNLAEHPIAYYMDACPGEILYCTATNALLDKWTKRLEPLIDTCGYRHKIVAQVENTKSKKTGDKMYSKEYSGGSLSMASLQAPSSMRSESKKILIVDEADGAPKKVTTGEGNFLGILRGRTAAYGSKSKIMELSTPTTIEDSVIYPQFMAGDQRYFNVPCPRDGCGCMIVLKFEQLRPIFNKDDQLESVFYECQECKGTILHKEKTGMMDSGEWIPTAIARSKGRRSYQINSLYSPIGFMSWAEIYEEYIAAEEDPDLKPSFTNLYLGLPYKEDGHRPKIKANEKRGDYKRGTVPHGVLYLTMAGDVQRGKVVYQDLSADDLSKEIARIRKDQGEIALWKSKIPRIEMEVYGVGSAYRSWQVDYKVFYGHTTHGPYEGAFEEMYNWVQDTELKYKRQDGRVFSPNVGLMDASDGVTKSAVYEFCERVGGNMYPNVNDGFLKKKKDPGVDEETRFNYDRYRIITKGGGIQFVNISTNHYKKIVYQRLKVDRDLDPSKPQRPAFCDFPRETEDHYFKMLTNEEQMSDGSFHNGGRPCEPLDIRGYNLCAADIHLESKARDLQKAAEKQGTVEKDFSKIKKWYLDKLETETKGSPAE